MKPEAAWPWLIRIGGFAGAMFEIFVTTGTRPEILALCAAMMGLADGLDRYHKRDEDGS